MGSTVAIAKGGGFTGFGLRRVVLTKMPAIAIIDSITSFSLGQCPKKNPSFSLCSLSFRKFQQTKNSHMIKFSELKPGDIVLADYEEKQWEGIVKELNREDKEVCVETDVQQFWFTPEHLHPILLNDEQLQKLNFEKQENNGTIKYMKGAFRIQLSKEKGFSDFEIWYREDRRHIKQPLAVHELQNHYYQMTKVELNED